MSADTARETPAGAITAMVDHVLALAATWTAWDGTPVHADDRVHTPHKAAPAPTTSSRTHRSRRPIGPSPLRPVRLDRSKGDELRNVMSQPTCVELTRVARTGRGWTAASRSSA
ncbi:hypothetical protein [Streptomyces sp. NPDC058964]|uniref:hypothetical protein n=1 Tax=Streptomyces sp. NPDC058964 TaxID=3346681 RepID=UPI0036AC2D65